MSDLLLAYYGDDFTGSTDVMEVMQWSGLRTVLFLQPPTASQLQSFRDLRGFGIAGWSRSMSPDEMDAELGSAFDVLRESGAKIVQYKICSTFDSSPDIGSIGKAIELGRSAIGTKCVPVVVGAPNLARYQVFGNLFARSGLDTEPFRLDRHPTMQQHPITPMSEADLRLHLAQQTQLEIRLLDVLNLKNVDAAAYAEVQRSGILLIDVLEEEDLARVGGVLQAFIYKSPQTYLVGSSGVEYALAAHWAECGQLVAFQSHPTGRPTFGPTDQIVAITGSCSPVNERQISWAEAHGFETLPLDVARLIRPKTSQDEICRVVSEALGQLRRGASLILHSARGPDDPRVATSVRELQALGLSKQAIRLHSGRIIGPKLGQILKRILAEHRISRVGVAGGDTSGYVARELGITALEAIAPVAPGSPLCRTHAENDLHGLEIFFKGGQVGKDDVWSTMLTGSSRNETTA